MLRIRKEETVLKRKNKFASLSLFILAFVVLGAADSCDEGSGNSGDTDAGSDPNSDYRYEGEFSLLYRYFFPEIAETACLHVELDEQENLVFSTDENCTGILEYDETETRDITRVHKFGSIELTPAEGLLVEENDLSGINGAYYEIDRSAILLGETHRAAFVVLNKDDPGDWMEEAPEIIDSVWSGKIPFEKNKALTGGATVSIEAIDQSETYTWTLVLRAVAIP